MTNTGIAATQRFRRTFPCPICDGGNNDPRGEQRRCYGFLSEDGEWAHCTREEHAGRLALHKDGTYPHRLVGDCRCGVRHDARPNPPLKRATPHGRPKELLGMTAYEIRDVHGTLVAYHDRKDILTSDGEIDKLCTWRLPDGKRSLNGTSVTALPLYGSERLNGSVSIVLTEGEKAADALLGLGIPALGTVTGAATIPDIAVLEVLRDRRVVLWPDNDDAGRRHMEGIAARLWEIGIQDIRVLVWDEAPLKGDAADYVTADTTRADVLGLLRIARSWEAPELTTEPIAETDLYAYMEEHKYIFIPTRALWPAASVNSRLPAKPTGRLKENGKPEYKPASWWLDRDRPVEQMTWAPGLDMVVEDRLLREGGWVDRTGSRTFNLYQSPIIEDGNPADATRWIDHLYRLYPTEAEHMILWLAHRVQRPGEKINHAIVLGGQQGIGKDSIIEPVKHAVGPWNVAEVSPMHLLGRFNGFVKSVILRVSEARDLGESEYGKGNRYTFYEHMKTYTAAPPTVLRCDEKNIREYGVLNVCGVVITTNHKTDGIYLPADDRRHFVAWSDLTIRDFEPDYFGELYRWYEDGGSQAVSGYLRSLDISQFDPKAPPPKTAAFWDIVDANRAPEDGDLNDALEVLGHPQATTLERITQYASTDFAEWLRERKNRRNIPYRLEAVGYVRVRNEQQGDGRWKVAGKNQIVYARQELSVRDRIAVARQLADDARS